MVSPAFAPLIAYAKAWTPGTNGVMKGKCLRVKIEDKKDFDKYRGKLAGMIARIAEKFARGLGAPLGCLSEARYGIVWGAVGAGRACFEAALDYSKQRIQGGKPIWVAVPTTSGLKYLRADDNFLRKGLGFESAFAFPVSSGGRCIDRSLSARTIRTPGWVSQRAIRPVSSTSACACCACRPASLQAPC